MRCVTGDEMRRIDSLARRRYGVPELILMEHAGTAVAHLARKMLQSGSRKGSVLILAGGGSNGGDGLAAARHLDNWGFSVRVLLFAKPSRMEGAAKENLRMLAPLGVRVEPILSLSQWRREAKGLGRASLAIDALLGTGAKGDVRQPMRSAIEWLNARKIRVLSVDLPSGLSADSGNPCGVCVHASVTVTCGFPKKGLTRAGGRRFSGQVHVADIALPRRLR